MGIEINSIKSYPDLLRAYLTDFHPVEDLWVTWGIRSKQELQQVSLKNRGFFADSHHISLKDLWEKILELLGYKVLPESLVGPIVKNTFGLQDLPVDLNLIVHLMRSYGALILNPSVTEEIWNQSELPNTLKKSLELALKLADFMIHAKKWVLSQWAPYVIEQHIKDLDFSFWNFRKCFIDVSIQLRPIEIQVIQKLAKNLSIVLIWRQSLLYSSQPYLPGLKHLMELCGFVASSQNVDHSDVAVQFFQQKWHEWFSIFNDIKNDLNHNGLNCVAVFMKDPQKIWPFWACLWRDWGLPVEGCWFSQKWDDFNWIRLIAYLRILSGQSITADWEHWNQWDEKSTNRLWSYGGPFDWPNFSYWKEQLKLPNNLKNRLSGANIHQKINFENFESLLNDAIVDLNWDPAILGSNWGNFAHWAGDWQMTLKEWVNVFFDFFSSSQVHWVTAHDGKKVYVHKLDDFMPLENYDACWVLDASLEDWSFQNPEADLGFESFQNLKRFGLGEDSRLNGQIEEIVTWILQKPHQKKVIVFSQQDFDGTWKTAHPMVLTQKTKAQHFSISNVQDYLPDYGLKLVSIDYHEKINQKFSVTRLEKFMKCGFLDFISSQAHFDIPLERPNQLPYDLEGIIWHKWFERILTELIESHGWDLNQEQLKHLLKNFLETEKLPHESSMLENPLYHVGLKFVEFEKKIRRHFPNFQTIAMEQPIEFFINPSSGEVTLEKKENFWHIKGRIDRIDVFDWNGQRFLIIWDYKRKHESKYYYFRFAKSYYWQTFLYTQALDLKESKTNGNVIAIAHFFYRDVQWVFQVFQQEPEILGIFENLNQQEPQFILQKIDENRWIEQKNEFSNQVNYAHQQGYPWRFAYHTHAEACESCQWRFLCPAHHPKYHLSLTR